jgi:integrase
MGDYIERAMEKKRRKLAPATLVVDEYAAKIHKKELGHLKPGACGPDRIEQYEADLMDGKITGTKVKRSAVNRYSSSLKLALKLAVRDGAAPIDPFSLVERERNDTSRPDFDWISRESILGLIAASERVAQKPDSRYDYSPLIEVLVKTGPRPSEGLALQARDIDLLGGRMHIRHSLGRDGVLGLPKTAAGVRVVPLSEELVNLFAGVIPADAEEDDFVFHAKGNPKRPLSYWNFRSRGFVPALKEAKLDGKGITVHHLRHAAVSMMAWSGLTMVEVAAIIGHADSSVTAKVYAHLFDRTDVEARVRAAQASLTTE